MDALAGSLLGMFDSHPDVPLLLDERQGSGETVNAVGWAQALSRRLIVTGASGGKTTLGGACEGFLPLSTLMICILPEHKRCSAAP
jgi:hypothetical protein